MLYNIVIELKLIFTMYLCITSHGKKSMVKTYKIEKQGISADESRRKSKYLRYTFFWSLHEHFNFILF